MDNEIQKLLDLAENDRNHSSVSFAERCFSEQQILQKTFSQLKAKILNIEDWNEAAALNNFKLFDENGNEYESLFMKKNLFIRILLKGSGKYDWVKIIQINEREDAFIITVKPTYNPIGKSPDHSQTSHFLTSESSNNFCLQKEADKISFYVIGLNEKQNVCEAESTLEVIRNVATANIGSYLGIQRAEWETFSINMLNS